MEMGRRRLDDDRVSGNRSLGSSYYPCSQTRKTSIGVMVDSSSKMKSRNGKGAEADLQTSQNVSTAKVFVTESQRKRNVISPDLGTQNKAPRQESSQQVHSKTSYPNVSYAEETGHQKKVSSLPSTTNATVRPNGSKTAGENRGMEPGSYFANQMLNLQAMNATEMKSKNSTYQKEKESSYATPQKELEPQKGITEQGTSERGNSGPVTLRMKVQELLETVYSPNKKQPNSETFGMDANISKPKSTSNGNDSLHTRKTNSGTFGMRANSSKPKSTTNGNGSLHTRKTNSETFEMGANNSKPKSTTNGNGSLQTRTSNSGSLDKSRRPLTRSLTGKKPQAQKSTPKKQSPLFQSKQAQFEENAFSFVDTWSKRVSTDVNNGFKSFKRKERDIFGTRVQDTDGKKTKAAGVNVSLFENRTRDSEKGNADTEMNEKKHQQFGGNNGSGLYNNVDVDSFAKDSLKDNVEPTFELKTAVNFSSPISLFQINKENIDVDSPIENVDSPLENVDSPLENVDTPIDNSFRTERTRSSNSKGFYTKNISMDVQDSPVIKPDREENKCFRSPSKVVESESSESEDDSPITVPVISKKFEGNKWCISPCQDEDSESSEDDSPVKGNGDREKIDDSSEQDGFAGAVKLFAMALERVQSKIHSATSKQSAAILLSVSNNIQSQLQNAESKIQNDVGKLTNLGKSKRMHPENQYQEQQEQLKHIYEKFKEEVDQHLEKCKNTLEGLEAHQTQVSRMVEKQRVSHKKFLMQTEELIEKQLNEAQTRLTDVHRMAKEKMFKLKYGIAECLKEGLLT
ncbi:putative meiosis-specific protein ASY3 [Helianthus annuus]|nr:putative meiosis-specific protein ASY3 [Helianthus annuus]KAJ0878461.1 putative meiosis-specific protein ASY3 [Helianthus annuus]